VPEAVAGRSAHAQAGAVNLDCMKKKKKKGDCIAVQPLDHRTTRHDYEQNMKAHEVGTISCHRSC
jgi:hypothetical protein